MESSNLSHHHHLLVSSSSSSSSSLATASSPSCFGLAQTTPLNIHPTSSSINLMNHLNFNPSRLQQINDLSAPNNINSMAQDFGYHHQYWGCGDLGAGGLNSNNNHHSAAGSHDYGSSSSSSDSYPKFTDLLLQSSSVVPVVVNSNSNSNNSNLGQDLNMQPTSFDHLYSSSNMIFPTINVSNLTQQSTLEMNLEALDLFSNCGRFGHGDHNNQLISSLISSSYGVAHQMQQNQQQSINSHGCSPSSSINTSAKLSEGASNFSLIDDNGDQYRVKRAAFSSTDDPDPANLMKPNTNSNSNPLSHHPPPQKKSRPDSRASCPPFKVRKEKLGDRIAALQQLVAPFGKTDTASVLMEAIGYIKFLQNQVETLSVPYMKASRNKKADPSRHQASSELDPLDIKKEEPGRSGLRSRGLCLVPLSCLSYVTTDGGGGIWPANFNGA